MQTTNGISWGRRWDVTDVIQHGGQSSKIKIWVMLFFTWRFFNYTTRKFCLISREFAKNQHQYKSAIIITSSLLCFLKSTLLRVVTVLMCECCSYPFAKSIVHFVILSTNVLPTGFHASATWHFLHFFTHRSWKSLPSMTRIWRRHPRRRQEKNCLL